MLLYLRFSRAARGDDGLRTRQREPSEVKFHLIGRSRRVGRVDAPLGGHLPHTQLRDRFCIAGLPSVDGVGGSALVQRLIRTSKGRAMSITQSTRVASRIAGRT